jgi:hypothetical protein
MIFISQVFPLRNLFGAKLVNERNRFFHTKET